MAERTVKTAKSLLKEAADPHLALLTYGATPLPWCHLSPAELLMGRKLRTDVPSIVTSLIPQWEFLRDFREKDRERKEKQKTQFNKRHRTQPLLDISGGHRVELSEELEARINLAPSNNATPQATNGTHTRDLIMIRTRLERLSCLPRDSPRKGRCGMILSCWELLLEISPVDYVR